jgi:diguanylate cyclase (GGDEF)-like protein/PAS domain S-box-containing protein
MSQADNCCTPPSLDQCSSVFSGLPIVFYRLDPQVGGCFFSLYVEELTGYRPDELTSHSPLWQSLIHADDLPAVTRAIDDALAGLHPLDLEYRVRHKEGHWVWVHDRSVRHADIEGRMMIEGALTDVSMRKSVEIVLSETMLRMEHVFDSLDAAVLLYDNKTFQLSDSNTAAEKIFGYPQRELPTLPPSALFPDDAAFAAFDALARTGLQSSDRYVAECTMRRANGVLFPAEVRLRRLNVESGTNNFVAVINDLSQVHEYEESLALARQVFDNASEAVMITDASNRIVSVNAAFTRITGWGAEDAIGRDPGFLSSGKQTPEFYREMWKVLQDAGVWQGEVVNRRRSGQYYPEWLSISTVRNRQGQITHYLAIFSDISERKRAEGLIHRYSWFDSLTDLPNKALLTDRINQAIVAARNEGKPLYLMAINLNRLKQINDSYGHRTGDEVLKVVAQRLLAGTREGDTVSRITGDDYVVVVPRLSQPHRAMQLTDRLLQSVNEPIEIEGNSVHVTANAGIVSFPTDGDDPEVLLQNADAALNHARGLGAHKISFFEPHMNTSILEKVSLQNELALALTRGEFLLYFQPQVSLVTGALAGLEALIRWQHPTRGMVSPAMFIPTAEEQGLIIDIGAWVIDEACRSLAAWRRDGHDGLLVAVNLSALQFTDANLLNIVQQAIDRHGIPAGNLELEITEGLAMHDANEVLTRLQALKTIGVKLSIDDFGTGYSSLAYLRRFPVDKLKIDQSFVRDMSESAEAASIVGAVVALGHGLGLNVIAEGVETEMQRQSLDALHCDEIQGYLLSRPISFGDMSQWLQHQATTQSTQ